MTLIELNSFVRYYLAGVSTDVISDEDLNYIIQMMLDSGIAENDCQEKFYATTQTLLWLDRKNSVKSAMSAGSGEVKSRKEKVGEVEVTESYETGEYASTGGWLGLYNNLIADPTLIGCTPFITTGSGGSVIIGGADCDPYSNEYRSRDRRQKAAYDSKPRSPWRPYDVNRKKR